MPRLPLRLLPLILLVSLAVPPAQAQAGISRKQQEKIQRQKARKDAKAVKLEEKHLLKEHLQHQDKATRKRMKKHRRGALRQGQEGQREPFPKRLFHRKKR